MSSDIIGLRVTDYCQGKPTRTCNQLCLYLERPDGTRVMKTLLDIFKDECSPLEVEASGADYSSKPDGSGVWVEFKNPVYLLKIERRDTGRYDLLKVVIGARKESEDSVEE